MNDENARKKEADRTLNRIKQTLGKLGEEPSPDSLEQSEEFQRMKNLLERGYDNPPGPGKRFSIMIWHPVFIIFLIIALFVLIKFF